MSRSDEDRADGSVDLPGADLPGADLPLVARQRIDRWLWCARFFKTRALAARIVGAGRVRVNGARIVKPAFAVKPGDRLTFPQGRAIRVVSVRALAARRVPAPQAAALYDDASPPLPPPAETANP